jgi:tetratricopeptide (TPR) repeat protein
MGYYHLVEKKDAKAAIKIFTRNVKEFPKSANTYDSLADAYEADGQIEEALKQMDLAVAIVKKDISLFRVISEHRERLLNKQKNSVENNIEDKVIPTEQ